MKPILRSSICLSVSFVQSLMIAILAIFLLSLITLTPEFTADKIAKSNYGDLAFAEMTEDLNDLSIPAGLPHDFFNDKLSSSDFKELLTSKVLATIKGKKITVDVEEVKATLKAPIEKYIIDTLSTDEPVWDEALSQFVNECTTTYLEYLSPTSFELIFSNFQKFFSVIKVAAIVVLAAVLGFFVFLYKLTSTENFFKFSFTAFAGAGLICSVFPLYLLITDEISRIGIGALSLYSFVCTFVTDFLKLFVIFGFGLVVISVIFLAIEIVVLRKRAKSLKEVKNT